MPQPNSTEFPIKSAGIESWQTNPRLVTGRSNKAAGITVLGHTEQGIPKPVTSVAATSTHAMIGGAKYAQVQVTHNTDSNDNAFHHSNVWVTGLNGNPNPQLQSASTASPHILLLPATGGNVTITVQSVGKDGSLLPMKRSPTTTVSL